MPAKSLFKIALMTAPLMRAAVITDHLLYAPDRRSGTEKLVMP